MISAFAAWCGRVAGGQRSVSGLGDRASTGGDCTATVGIFATESTAGLERSRPVEAEYLAACILIFGIKTRRITCSTSFGLTRQSFDIMCFLGDRKRMVRIRRAHLKTMVRRCLQTFSTHQFLDRRPADFEAAIDQFFIHPRTAVYILVMFRVDSLHLADDILLTLGGRFRQA